MSKTTKKRFITKQHEMEFVLPDEDDRIARVTASRGSYLVEVIDECGETYLVSMPAKFRHTIWVKRGSFVIVEPIEEGDKVRAEVKHILDDENILNILHEGLWPVIFDAYARALTREAKRGNIASVGGIDADMLPPSDNEEDELDEDSADAESENENGTEQD